MPSSSKLRRQHRILSIDATIAANRRRRESSKGSSPSSSPSPAPTSKPAPRRRGTLYDAVAGRLTTNGFIDQTSALKPSYYRDIPSHGNAETSQSILRPDEVLSRQKGAPDRYEEDDWYTQHRHLVPTEEEAQRVRADIDYMNELDYREDGITEEERARLNEFVEPGTKRLSSEVIDKLKAQVKVGTLPDGELLTAVHEFASLYYAVHGGELDYGSLDETALLAMGVLLEETVREALGETGWKVFVEGVEDQAEEEVGLEVEEEGPPQDESGKSTSKTVGPKSVFEQDKRSPEQDSESSAEDERPPRKKRRKIIEWGDDW